MSQQFVQTHDRVKTQRKVIMENENLVISEREKELGSHIVKVTFIGCKNVQKSDVYGEMDLVQKTPYRDKYNNGYTTLKLYPKKDKMPKVFIPFGSEVDAVFLNVPEGEKPVFLRLQGLERFVPKDDAVPEETSTENIPEDIIE